jgi:hypothetical protein
MLALWGAAAGIVMKHGSDTLDLLLWIIVLIVQSLPYLAALLMTLVSGLPRMSAKPLYTDHLAAAGKEPAGVSGHPGLPTAHQK